MESGGPISSREFTRETVHIRESLGRIEAHLERLNGKTASNTERIAVLERNVGAIVDEDREIDRKVDLLTRQGCAQYAAHTQMLQELAGVTAWTPQRKAAVAGTLVGTGALMWPALQRIAEAVNAVLTHGR